MLKEDNVAPSGAIYLGKIPKQSFYAHGIRDTLPKGILLDAEEYGYRDDIMDFIKTGIDTYVPPQSTVTAMLQTLEIAVLRNEDQSSGNLILCGDRLVHLRQAVDNNTDMLPSKYTFDGQWFYEGHSVKGKQKQRQFSVPDTFVELNTDALIHPSPSQFLDAILTTNQITHVYLNY